MSCSKHPLRKRKDCPDCIEELKSEHAPAPKLKEEVKVVVPAVTKSLKDVIASKKKKAEEPLVVIELKKEEPSVELNKMLKEDISEYIRKEVKKAVAMVTEELISEEARAQAKKVAAEAMDKAIESYKWKVKELSDVQYETLAIPLNLFRVVMFDKLTREGWKMVQTFIGEVAKVSQFKTDVVIFTRVKNDKWPKAPEFK